MELFFSKIQSAFSKKINTKVMAKWMKLFVLPLFVMLSYTGIVSADDLMSAGAKTVTDTFGASSAIAKWIILAEVIVGIITYIKTKNMFMLFGIAIVIVFTTIGFGLAG